MVDYKPCERCKTDLGIDVLVDTILKKDKSGTYMKNLDGSYHVQPFEVQGQTKWFHVSSKEHAEWTRTHGGPSGFIQAPQQAGAGTAQPPKPQESPIASGVKVPPKVEMNEQDKALFNLYKQKMQGVIILEAAVREVLIERGNNSPDPRQVGLYMKLVGELA